MITRYGSSACLPARTAFYATSTVQRAIGQVQVLIGGGQEASQVTTTSSRAGKFESRFFHKARCKLRDCARPASKHMMGRGVQLP